MAHKNAKKIPESIKEIIKTYGKNVVKDIRLASILDDIASYDELPAAKPVLRTLLKGGYGARILDSNSHTDEWKLRIKSFVSEISDNYGYQTNIVEYLLYSIAYGLNYTTVLPLYNTHAIVNLSIQENKLGVNDLKTELKNLKDEYQKLLHDLLVCPSSSSAYYPASALTQLNYIEGKIKLISDALGQNNDDWCKTEKNMVLQEHYIDVKYVKIKAYTKIAVIGVIVIICGALGISYFNSLDEIKSFEQTINEGDAFMASGFYDQAVAKYCHAYTNYDAFNSSSYKKDAFNNIDKAIDKLIENSEHNNPNLLLAYNLLQSELQLDLKPDEREIVQDKINQVKTEMFNRVDNGKNSLILNISANKGKLGPDGIKLLEELMLFSPDDYWLNFIKTKEQ